jgi:integrase
MARKIRDQNLDSRTARDKLPIRGRLYYKRVQENLAIGYRKLRNRSGTWTARMYVGNGEYAYEVIGEADDRSDANGLTVLSFDEAVSKARDLHLDRAKQAAGIHGPITVEQAFAAYITALDQDGKNTDPTERIAAKYILPLIGQHEVGKLTTEMLNKWKADVAAMPAKGKRPHDPRARKSSANGTLARLKAALNLAFEAGKVASNSAWKNVKKFEGVDRSRKDFLTVDQCKRLINAAGDEFRPMVQAALQTGCRYMELCSLKVKDFDIDNKTIFISHSKNGRERYVHLAPEGVQLFETLATGRRASDPLIRRTDGLPFNTSQQVRRMKLACKNARIDPIPFHSLRHTYASLLIKAKVPLVYVAESLGHTSINMVTKHYGHIDKGHFAETISASVPSFGFAKTNVRTLKHRA